MNPQKQLQQITLAAPIELLAGSDPSKLPSKFSGIAYSGGRVPGHEIVIDMATARVAGRLPILSDHNRALMVGVSDETAIQDNRLTIAGKLFSDMPGSVAERIAMLSQRGAPFEMSVGVFDFTREFVPAGKTINVNGATFSGPIDVLRNSAIREVSIVTIGADPNTSTEFFQQPDGGRSMSIEQLTAQVADLTAQLAAAKAPEALAAARGEGATAERTRIQAVESACLAGHESIIAVMKFDGKSTGADAALAVLDAEKQMRARAAVALAKDAPKPAAPAATPAFEAAAKDPMADASKPIEERCKAKWDSDPQVRAEFTSLATFTAMSKAEESGNVRVLNKRAA